MNKIPDTTEPGPIDVDRILRSKNPTLAKAIPTFIINYLKRIVHQDDLNNFPQNLRSSERF
jgi:hypothetical protein